MQKILQNAGHNNPAKFEQELVELAKQVVSKNPDVSAILPECTAFPTYAGAIQEAVRPPVFDFTTIINWVYSAVVRRLLCRFYIGGLAQSIHNLRRVHYMARRVSL